MKKLIFTFYLVFFTTWVFAQIPAGYYNPANGKKEYALKTALFGIIKGHVERTYNNLWTDFQTTDKKADGKVWDMYSNCSFTFVTNQCGNYQNVCDCYNREHSFPKSWFNDATPMYTDLFHLYPTDGKVNGMRGNYPFGETNGTVWGTGKVGACTFPGYTGTVFEPADEYKGDFARTYLYMATCYQDKVAGWISNPEAVPMLAGNDSSVYKTWAINLLLKWHHQDPVSEKETNRNNAVYGIQQNRNPFIDYPELVDLIWGQDFGQPFVIDGTPVITGSTLACENSQMVYKTDKGNTNYHWAVTNGTIVGAANVDSVVIAWSALGSGNISVNYMQGAIPSETADLAITINKRPIPVIAGDTVITEKTHNHKYTTTGGKSNYQWTSTENLGLAAGGNPTDSSATFSAKDAGQATVYLSYTENGCEPLNPAQLNITIQHKSGIEAVANPEQSVVMYPNPVSNMLTIRFAESSFTGSFTISNTLGKIVAIYQVNANKQIELNMQDYPNGIYFLQMNPLGKQAIHKKIIISH